MESSSSSKAPAASVADSDELTRIKRRNRTAEGSGSGLLRAASSDWEAIDVSGCRRKKPSTSGPEFYWTSKSKTPAAPKRCSNGPLNAANRSGPWRSWRFLTLQIQIAAEQCRPPLSAERRTADPPPPEEQREEAPSEWKSMKERIREQIPEIAFLNWFDATRQVERCGDALAVIVPDEPTAAYIAAEYGSMVHTAAAKSGITEIHFVLDNRGKEAVYRQTGIAGSSVEESAIGIQAARAASKPPAEGSVHQQELSGFLRSAV